MNAAVGVAVVGSKGDVVGAAVGCAVSAVGAAVGCTEGETVGIAVERAIGCPVGEDVGAAVGFAVGFGVGTDVGWAEGDVVGIREKSRTNTAVIDSLEIVARRGVPSWIELDKDNYKATVKAQPNRDEITMPIQEHLIVELYSK